jgi:hypothetical protein
MYQRQMSNMDVAVDPDSEEELDVEDNMEDNNNPEVEDVRQISSAAEINNDDDDDNYALDLHDVLEHTYDPLDDVDEEEAGADTEKPKLPPHFRCVCHTLNLIASSDVTKGLKSNADLSKQSKTLHETLSKVWKKQGKSGAISELIDQSFGHRLVTPVKTR